MKKLLLCVPFLLVGCGVHTPSQPEVKIVQDQCIRERVFLSCLTIMNQNKQKVDVPNEVVKECSTQAYYISQRTETVVDKLCK